jgi:hypothetical protein
MTLKNQVNPVIKVSKNDQIKNFSLMAERNLQVAENEIFCPFYFIREY